MNGWVNSWLWPGEVLFPQHVPWNRGVPRGSDLGWLVYWFRLHAPHVGHAGVVSDVVVHHGGKGWREAETNKEKKGRWFHQVATEDQFMSKMCVQDLIIHSLSQIVKRIIWLGFWTLWAQILILWMLIRNNTNYEAWAKFRPVIRYYSCQKSCLIVMCIYNIILNLGVGKILIFFKEVTKAAFICTKVKILIFNITKY